MYMAASHLHMYMYMSIYIDIWYFLICRLVDKYVQARPFPTAMIGGSGSQAQASGPRA